MLPCLSLVVAGFAWVLPAASSNSQMPHMVQQVHLNLTVDRTNYCKHPLPANKQWKRAWREHSSHLYSNICAEALHNLLFCPCFICLATTNNHICHILRAKVGNQTAYESKSFSLSLVSLLQCLQTSPSELSKWPQKCQTCDFSVSPLNTYMGCISTNLTWSSIFSRSALVCSLSAIISFLIATTSFFSSVIAAFWLLICITLASCALIAL